jgi:hypothetical protein
MVFAAPERIDNPLVRTVDMSDTCSGMVNGVHGNYPAGAVLAGILSPKPTSREFGGAKGISQQESSRRRFLRLGVTQRDKELDSRESSPKSGDGGFGPPLTSRARANAARDALTNPWITCTACPPPWRCVGLVARLLLQLPRKVPRHARI